VRQLQGPGGIGDDGRGTAAAADQLHQGAFHPVLLDQLFDHNDDLGRSQVEQPGGDFLPLLLPYPAQPGEDAVDDRPVAASVADVRDEIEIVGRLGGGEGVGGLLPFNLDAQIVLRVAGPRLDQVLRKYCSCGDFRKRGVPEAGDVGAARADIGDAVLFDPRHRTAADADGAHIEGAQVELVAADDGTAHQGPAVADGRDVRAGAADLDKDSVRDAGVHQRRRHAGGGAGEHGQDGPAPNLVDLHDAAVAAHHHQRSGDPRSAHALFGSVRRFEHFRQHTRIDHRRAGADAQPVELRDDRGGAGRQAHRGSGRDDPLFIFRIVDPERLAGDDHLGALRHHFTDQGADFFLLKRAAVEEPVHGVDELAGCQLDVADIGFAPGAAALETARHPDHPHPGDIPLKQGVGRLGGAVGDQGHLLRQNLPLFEQLVHGLDHAAGHPLRSRVGGGQIAFGDDLVIRGVHRHRMGEGAADIDADLYPALHGFHLGQKKSRALAASPRAETTQT